MPALVPDLEADIVALHLGALHPVEQVLTLVLAFGPFAVLGIVIALRRRSDRLEDQPIDQPADPIDQPTDQAER